MPMSKEEMIEGFKRGRQLTQEEWSKPSEKQAVDQLLSEGKCRLVADWEYKDNFQCERRIVIGVEE